MQCYTELVPPTAVSHAVSLPFLSPEADNLVVAKTSVLQLFSLRSDKLSLVGEYPLAGTVTALQRIKTQNTKSGGEALLVAFRDAKLSLVEWDPENHRISTVSIHYYEGDNVLLEPFGSSLRECQCVLTVDPESRCAALKFGARQVAILPFKQQGDDLVDGEDDLDMDAEPQSAVEKRRTHTEVDGEAARETPYRASFVVPLTIFDSRLTHPVDLVFLHEYREPTFGILSSNMQPSNSLLEERKDCLAYTVFTLDLEQRASTNLISVPKLPSDLWKVVPLPLPVGGALLVGTNELVHIDQSGKANAVAVNEFAKASSNFTMTDQSHLNLKLEGCDVAPLDRDNGDLLITLNDASLAVLSFKLSGRTVGGLSLTIVPPEKGGLSVESAPSCVTALRGNKLFVGSEDGNSRLLSWNRSAPSLSRKRSHAQMLGQDRAKDDDEDSEEVDEDDLYAPAPDAATRSGISVGPSDADKGDSYNFEIADSLPSLGPISDICIGKASGGDSQKLEIVAATGRGRGSRLAFMNRDIFPERVMTRDMPGTQNLWSICARKKRKTSSDAATPNDDNMLFVFDGTSTKPYDLSDGDHVEKTDTEFEAEGETTYISTLADGTRIVQCRRTEIRTYDSDLGLSQIIPQTDDETDAELSVVHISVSDPYLLVLRDDSSIQVHQVDKSGDVEPLDTEGTALAGRKWLGGGLYQGSLTNDRPAAFLLGDDGSLRILSLPDLTEVYTAPNMPFLPPVLSSEATQRRGGSKEALTEILITDVGCDRRTQPYLVLRTSTDDLVLYEPFHPTNEGPEWSAGLRFRKVPLKYVPKFDETAAETSQGRPAPLRAVTVGRYDAIYIPGPAPSFVVKEACSLPKVLSLRIPDVKGFTRINRPESKEGFGTIGRGGTVHEWNLPVASDFSTGWNVKTLDLGQEVRHLAYYQEQGMYVVATSRNVDFVFVEEDNRHHEQDDISMRPQVPQCTLHLLSAATHRVIHSYNMPYTETITSLKVMPLEVSEHTHEQKSMVVVGTAALRGEDMPAKGAVTVFEVLPVVPEPNDPETGLKLHVVAREETKGAVTAVESFNGGLIGTSQGQKIMIRGLKEDGSCLPVAFLDAQCQLVTLKTFGKSGLWLGGDCWKGVWFGGFVEEPYKLTLLGKGRPQMEVVAAEFLPFDGQLFLIVVDADCDLHVLQYDPENPKSLSGTRLLHRSTFHLGQFPTGMLLVPSELAPFAAQEKMVNGDSGDSKGESNSEGQAPSLFHVLVTSATGSLSLLTPLDEPSYRRLTALQTHLTTILEHPCGLNPRAYRAVSSEEFGARGVVDGDLVMRVGELGSLRRAEVLGRAGMDAWEWRGDGEILGGGGLGYL